MSPCRVETGHSISIRLTEHPDSVTVLSVPWVFSLYSGLPCVSWGPLLLKCQQSCGVRPVCHQSVIPILLEITLEGDTREDEVLRVTSGLLCPVRNLSIADGLRQSRFVKTSTYYSEVGRVFTPTVDLHKETAEYQWTLVPESLDKLKSHERRRTFRSYP